MDDLEILDSFDAVAEITSNAVTGMVPLPTELVQEVTQGDDDPKFATVVIESGWSRSKRLWEPEIFDSVAEQINNGGDEVVGYLGHITPDNDPYVFPEIQIQWLKARVQKVGDKARIAVKGYVLPGTKAREYLDRPKPLVKTFSWAGKAAQIPFERGLKVTQFQIKSIDLARPRSAGMSARLVGALTSEMENGGNEVKPEEIAALQENELRAHNPALATAIETSAKKPLEDKISEMESEAAAVKPTLDLVPALKKALGLSEDTDEVGVISTAITALTAEGKKLRETVLDSVLAKRFKGGSDSDRALVRRVLVGEMTSKDLKLTGDTEKDEKVVSEMVTEIVDADPSLKETISEMEAAPPAPSHKGDRPGDREEWKPGVSTSRVRVKARS